MARLTPALRAFLPCLLALLLACSEDPAPGSESNTDTVDEADDDEADDADDEDVSGDGKKDTPVAPMNDAGSKLDAGAKSGTGNGDTKPDGGSAKSDGGGAKVDTGAVQTDGGKPDDKAADGTRPKPKCMKKDSQLIVIGDSFINWGFSHKFPEQMVEKSGQKWRMEAVGGYSMASGGFGLIPPEFDDSIKRDPDAHSVLMDGGGNDILLADASLDLLGECTSAGSSMKQNCQMIVKKAIDAADALMNRMATAGIRDVVYFFYPHIPANRALGGPAPNEILDYALPLVKDFCEGAEQRTSGKLRCTFIDMVPVFATKSPPENPVWFNSDIHPNDQGSQAMVDKVWEVMTEKCIGQKGPKDCCES